MSTEIERIEPDEDEEEEEDKSKIVPKRGHTLAQAKRGLAKFKRHAGMADFFHLSDIGGFIKDKGTDKTGIAMIVYAADVVKTGIQKCQEMTDSIEDPDLKVRLQENIKGLAEVMVKAGQSLVKAEEPTKGVGTDNKPSLPPFAANTVIQGNVLVQQAEKGV